MSMNAQGSQIRAQIRGSGLLLSGACLSAGVNFISQAIVARYLTASDYGAWGYALSVVAFLGVFARFGLSDAVSRFVPIYHEGREYGRLLGTLVVAFGTVLAIGSLVLIAIRISPHTFFARISDGRSAAVLLLLIVLVPIDATDGLLMSCFASFHSPSAIFFRRHVLAPGLKLAVVLGVLLTRSGIRFLAYGYLCASALGVVLYALLLLRTLRREGVLNGENWRRLRFPVRELLTYALPGVTSDAVSGLNHIVPVALLAYLFTIESVAAYRVIVPAAAMNCAVMLAFTSLYTPTAARLFARKDYRGINDLYWRTAVWVSVLSFPIFCATFCVSRSFTMIIYGAKYQHSSVYLAILAAGYYFNAALGFNGLTLKVLGKVRYLMICNVVAAVVGIVLNLVLVPRYGPLGAAIATSAAMILHNCLKQVGLHAIAGIHVFERRFAFVYLSIVAVAGFLYTTQLLSQMRGRVAIGLAAIASCLLVVVAQRSLDIGETFPEVLRIPLLKTLLAPYKPLIPGTTSSIQGRL